MMNQNILIAACVSLAIFCSNANGSDQIPGAPQTKPIAIVGATIHPVTAKTIENGVIVFQDGKITSVGTKADLPSECEVIQGEGKHVYPSLIEAYSDIGLVEINSVAATIDSSELGEFNSNVRAAVAFNPDSELIPVNRANGILLALSAPSGGLVAGRSSLMMLDGWTWEDMTLQPDVGMHVEWPRADGEVAELDEFVEQAKRYAAAKVDANVQPQVVDLRLEAMINVLDQTTPLIVSASSAGAIQAAVAFANHHKLRLIIYGGYDAPKCAKLLVEQKVPVIIAGVYRNPSRRNEPYDDGYTLPKRLQDAGVQYCIATGGSFGASGIRNLPYNAATAVGYGLSEEDALRSITLAPAEILGVGDRVGALEVGHDATLFIADGDILETPTQVEAAFVQGRTVDLDNKHRQLYRKYSAKYGQQP